MKKPFINNQIKAREVRLVDEEGRQLGIISFSDAMKQAMERGLDLIQVTEKLDPPVCKIGDYGKFLYSLKKKEKKTHKKTGELKSIRLTFNISDNDLRTRIKTAEKTLKENGKIKIDMRLRGRERGLTDHAVEKVNRFLEILNETTEYKIEKELKKEPRGYSMIISKK